MPRLRVSDSDDVLYAGLANDTRCDYSFAYFGATNIVAVRAEHKAIRNHKKLSHTE